MYTGDDFNYAELIAGDGVGGATNQRHSDALLGIFDAIAPAASAALAALAAGDVERFHAILAPTVPLSRHIFQAPTRFYKTGIVFLAWLNGHQSHFTMVGGQQSARSLAHFAEHLPPRRRRRPARAARARGRANAPPARAARHRRLSQGLAVRDFSGRSPLALDQHRDAARRRHARPHRRGVRAPRHPRHLAVARPGRGDRPRAHGARSCASTAWRSRATAAAACSRRWTRPAAPAALDDNRRAVDEAKTLDAACLVLVVGGLPGALAGTPQSKDLFAARRDVRDGIAATLEYARSVGMPLAIEPLHPMYAADRACVNTIEQALDLCDALDPPAVGAGAPSPALAGLGVAVDVYHVWWDPKLEAQIARAGRDRLLAFHVCDWLVPTRDLLNDRGMMGDGVIEIPRIRAWVEAAGFAGYSEVEIFSSENWWKRPADEVLATCIERHRSAV